MKQNDFCNDLFWRQNKILLKNSLPNFYVDNFLIYLNQFVDDCLFWLTFRN